MNLNQVTTIEEYDQLDDDQVLDGYRDGIYNLPIEKSKLTRSYLHGYNNGQSDGGHAPTSIEQRNLVKKLFEVGHPSVTMLLSVINGNTYN